MRIGASLLAALLFAAPDAAASPAVFEPQRAVGNHGHVITIQATPENVPAGVARVAFAIDSSMLAGRISAPRTPVISRRMGNRFETVELRLRIDRGAFGEMPIPVKIYHLDETSQPGAQPTHVVQKAFVVAVEMVAQPSTGGSSRRSKTTPAPTTPTPSPAPPAPTPVPVPIGPVTTSYITPEIAALAGKIDRDSQHLDGMDATLKGRPEDTGVPADKAAAQLAFLQLNDLIIEQLRNPTALIGTNEFGEPEMDPQLLADFIEATGIFERDAARREALAQVASLGGPGVLPIINYETAELERPRPGTPIAWSQYSSIEALLVKILLRRMAENIQPGTEQMREVMEKLDEAIEKMGGEEAEGFKKAKMLFRPLALAGALVTVADIAGKAILALTPSEITHFYTLINETPREPGADPVVINVGQEMPVKVLMLTRAPGGQIVTPSEVAGWIWDNLPEKQKKKVTDKFQEGAMKGQLQQDVKKWISDKIAANPTVKAWVESANKTFDIPAFNGTPVEVNSTRVLHMDSKDDSKLEIVARQDGRGKRFAMIGRKPTPKGEAGYTFGLRPSTHAALKDADKTKFGLHNIRAVVTVAEQLTCNDTGKSCVPTKDEEAESRAFYTPEGAQWWKLVCGAGSSGRPAGACTCRCLFLAPH
jgi:hypothetical protein